jgi:hypothetical protein
MESELRGHLFDCARAYGAARGLELSTVGKLSTGDGKFFDRLTAGASFTARKYDAVLGWFADNWPDTPWPRAVPRPALEEAEHHRLAS